ncbi:MAG: energy-coupled thiamine transporter ThiT [Bacillota bacterium]|nr:energy-coupled thiamine transporter ThiT [Bacillota bacterium]
MNSKTGDRAAPAPARPRIPAQTITEVGLAVALAAVLHFIKVFEAPQGGSVSLEMLPLFFVALRRGAGTGVLAGALFGFFNLLLKPYVVTPVQFALDYPVAFGVLGVAGWFARRGAGGQVRVSRPAVLTGVIAGSALRFVAHLVSGVVFFAQYAPKGQNVWVYSALYNGGYMVPETLITAAVMWWLAGRKDLFGEGVR